MALSAPCLEQGVALGTLRAVDYQPRTVTSGLIRLLKFPRGKSSPRSGRGAACVKTNHAQVGRIRAWKSAVRDGTDYEISHRIRRHVPPPVNLFASHYRSTLNKLA